MQKSLFYLFRSGSNQGKAKHQGSSHTSICWHGCSWQVSDWDHSRSWSTATFLSLYFFSFHMSLGYGRKNGSIHLSSGCRRDTGYTCCQSAFFWTFYPWLGIPWGRSNSGRSKNASLNGLKSSGCTLDTYCSWSRGPDFSPSHGRRSTGCPSGSRTQTRWSLYPICSGLVSSSDRWSNHGIQVHAFWAWHHIWGIWQYETYRHLLSGQLNLFSWKILGISLGTGIICAHRILSAILFHHSSKFCHNHQINNEL